MEYTVEDGKVLIQFARKNLENYLKTGDKSTIPPELATKYGDKRGAFVTLNKILGKDTDLRGCIGIIMPLYPLIETIQNMVISAAVEDPRFPEVRLEELSKIIIEVSILSVPEHIRVSKPEEYLEKIVIGRDGLIVTGFGRRGLLLPQVPVEHNRNWDVTTFLMHTCNKAGLPSEAWKDLTKVSFESFTATIFEENTPSGEIHQKRIGE